MARKGPGETRQNDHLCCCSVRLDAARSDFQHLGSGRQDVSLISASTVVPQLDRSERLQSIQNFGRLFSIKMSN